MFKSSIALKEGVTFQFASIGDAIGFFVSIILAVAMPWLVIENADLMVLPEETQLGAFWGLSCLVAIMLIAIISLESEMTRKLFANVTWPAAVIFAVGFFGAMFGSAQSDWVTESIMALPTGCCWFLPFFALARQKWTFPE